MKRKDSCPFFPCHAKFLTVGKPVSTVGFLIFFFTSEKQKNVTPFYLRFIQPIQFAAAPFPFHFAVFFIQWFHHSIVLEESFWIKKLLSFCGEEI